MASLLLYVVMMTAHLPGIYLSGFSPQLKLFPLLSIPLSRFHDELYNFVRYLEHFKTIYYPVLWDHILCLFVVNPRHGYIFCFALLSLWMNWSMWHRLPFPLVPRWSPSCSSGNRLRFMSEWYFSSLICAVFSTYLGAFPFWGYFWIRVFPLCIHFF